MGVGGPCERALILVHSFVLLLIKFIFSILLHLYEFNLITNIYITARDNHYIELITVRENTLETRTPLELATDPMVAAHSERLP